MTDQRRKLGMDADVSLVGGGEAPDIVSCIKRDLEGWREVLIPMSAVLRWDQPYHPAILLGATTSVFALVWLFEISTLTTISLIALTLGLLDFGVPYFGPSVTGYKSWTAEEEYKFTSICENIARLRCDLWETWDSFVTMRQDNSKMFFIILIGTLSLTAWIGNLINNLLLTYLAVSFCLCLPGLMHNDVTRVYLLRGINTLCKIQAILMKPKVQ